MALVSIDLAAMESLISALRTAREEVPADAGIIRARLSRVMLGTSSVDPVSGYGAVWTWVEDSLRDLDRRLALARLIAGSTPGFGGTGVVEFDDVQVSTLTAAQVDALADRAAELMEVELEDLGNREDISEELLEVLADNAHDPYFARALAERVTPHELDLFLGTVNDYRQFELVGESEDTVRAFDERFDNLLGGLGMTYGLASQGTGELAVPGLTEAWTDYVAESGPFRTGAVNRLSTVIARGTWSTEFLVDMAGAVSAAEGDQGADFWAVGGMFSAFDPDLGTSPGIRTADDPMAGIFTALGANPEATRILFGSGDTTSVETDEGSAEVDASLYAALRHRGTQEHAITQLVGALQAAVMAPPVQGQPAWQPDLAQDLQAIGQALEREARIAEENAGPWWSRVGHALLDVVGLVPLLGEAADGVNGLWYLAEGNTVDAALSGASMLPIGGWFVQGGKWTRRLLNAEELAALDRVAETGDLARYLPGGRLADDAADLADPRNFSPERFLTDAELARFSGDRAWLRPLVAGRRFDTYSSPNYPHNQVYVRTGNGRYVILDSYVPGQAIVSRKLTQLADVQPSTATGYIDELIAKYPDGALIGDVPTTRAAGIAGTRLRGDLVLEVPPQEWGIPDVVLRYARENDVRIIGTNGVDYTAVTPPLGTGPR